MKLDLTDKETAALLCEPTDRSDDSNLNTGTPWNSWDDQDIRWGLDHNRSIEETADFLCRTPSEVRQRIDEIAEADAIGDPSLLHDGLTHRERIALKTYRDARAALALIREAVQDCAPPGSVPREDYLTPEFTVHAEALVRGIYAIAGRFRLNSCECATKEQTLVNRRDDEICSHEPHDRDPYRPKGRTPISADLGQTRTR
ncbi:MAG TPA: hypothetical protein VGI36_06585 [Candidatus Binataceae bacterium]|jgi:hypothetical protein